MADEFVDLKREGGVATVMLNRPPLNVMNLAMMERVNAVLLDLRGHSELKVLVVRGTGRAFSAGIDLHEHTGDKIARVLHVFHRIFETIRLLDVIAVAAVDGVALGGGFELALGCNLIVASESSRFGLPEITLGLFPPMACAVLARAAPRRKAMEWILTGEEISPEELQTVGLVNRVFADEDFEAGLAEFVGKLTSRSGPVLQLAKQAQMEAYYAAYEEAMYKAENLYLRDLMALEDSQEGIAAFLEKREPRWKDG